MSYMPSAGEQWSIGRTIAIWTICVVVLILLLGFVAQAFGLWTMPFLENRHTEK